MNDELAALKARCDRLELLNQVSNVIHSSLEPQRALHLIVSEAVRVMRATSGSIMLFNPASNLLEIEAAIGLPSEAAQLKLRLGEGITGWVARHGRPARVGDVRRDPRYVRVRDRVRSELAVPLEVESQLRGVLNVDADRVDAFSAADEALLQDLGIRAARVIQNTWLYEQHRLKARLFETLAHVGQTINSAVSLGDALRVITREACHLMEAKMASLLLLDETRQWLDLKACHGAGRSYLGKPRLSVEESFVGVVVRRKKALQLENVQTSGRYQNTGVARKEGLVSLLSVPLTFQQECIGALNVYTGRRHSFSNEEIGILSALANLSAVTIEKARLYEHIVEIEEQLRQSEKLSAIGLLAAEVAHEIRNPLTVMQMLFHSLDLRFPSGDPRRRDVEVMRSKMDHLNKIVEQVLDFARTNDPDLSQVNLDELLDELTLLTRHKLTQQGVTLVRKSASGIPPLRADATQLGQAFLNLTLNAVEAMPRGGTLTIRAGLTGAQREKDAARAFVEFKDTGEGMTSEQRRRVLGSLLNTTKSRGTGLGLAIVRRIVESHQGELAVKSRRGQGTTIRITLPLDGPEESSATSGSMAGSKQQHRSPA